MTLTRRKIKVGDLVQWGWPRYHSDERKGIVTRVDENLRGSGYRVPHPRVRYVVQWFTVDGHPYRDLDHVFDNEIVHVTESRNPWQSKMKTSE